MSRFSPESSFLPQLQPPQTPGCLGLEAPLKGKDAGLRGGLAPSSLLSRTCSGSFSPGPLSLSTRDEATRGRLHILQAGSILKVLFGSCRVRRHVLRQLTTLLEPLSQYPLRWFCLFVCLFCSVLFFLSGSPLLFLQSSQEQLLNQKYQCPRQTWVLVLMYHISPCKPTSCSKRHFKPRTSTAWVQKTSCCGGGAYSTKKCDHRGSSLGPDMESECILVHCVGGEDYMGCFLCFSLEYLGSNAPRPPPPHFGLRWRKGRGKYDRERGEKGERVRRPARL